MKKVIFKFSLLIIILFGLFFGANEINKITKEKSYNQLAVSKGESKNKDIEFLEEIKNNSEKVDNKEVINKIEEECYIQLPLEEVRIPILMYHSISDGDSNNSLLVPPTLFDQHIKWLSDNGFKSMSLDEVSIARTTGKVPEKPVVITFDDGYADNYTEAFPILQKYNMKGTFFIITDKSDKDGYFMSSDMLKEMKENGMEIENHTAYHLELNTLSREEQVASIENAQVFLNDIIGVKSQHLCYPVGRYDDITIEVAKELDIDLAVTTESGISSFGDESHKLKRIRISPMSVESFSSIFEEFME